MIKRITLATVLLFNFCVPIPAQNNDPYKLIENVRKKFGEIRDYQVDVTIKVDVNFLKVPESNARITFKQPDKIKLQSEGFALLPKQGLNFLPADLFNSEFSAIYIKPDSVDNHLTEIVKVVPTSDTLDIILSTLWIDPAYKIIRKIETTTKTTGSAEIDLYYDNPGKIPLPDKVVFSFNISGFKMPMGMSADFENIDKFTKGESQSMSGKVTVTYANYLINRGIDDSIFEETEDK